MNQREPKDFVIKRSFNAFVILTKEGSRKRDSSQAQNDKTHLFTPTTNHPHRHLNSTEYYRYQKYLQ